MLPGRESGQCRDVSGVADVGWKPPPLRGGSPRTRAPMSVRRGTILFLQEPDSHREDFHYMGSKNHRNELIWHLILRINSLAGNMGARREIL